MKAVMIHTLLTNIPRFYRLIQTQLYWLNHQWLVSHRTDHVQNVADIGVSSYNIFSMIFQFLLFFLCKIFIDLFLIIPRNEIIFVFFLDF